ncbi:MAG: pyridoxamine 5'-phosphate oxidase family protein [Verrucomicrobiota bacterium]
MSGNLHSKEAVEKLQSLVGSCSTCLFGTALGTIPIHVIPMQVQEVDDHGNLWLFSGADSMHNGHLANDPRVQMFFTNHNDGEYLTVSGHAVISHDRAKIGKLWDPTVEAWFPDGKEDPNVTLLCVSPTDVHYWASKHGKFVSLVKMAGAAISGNPPDAGMEGDLSV